jgi:hypothetical protein
LWRQQECQETKVSKLWNHPTKANQDGIKLAEVTKVGQRNSKASNTKAPRLMEKSIHASVLAVCSLNYMGKSFFGANIQVVSSNTLDPLNTFLQAKDNHSLKGEQMPVILKLCGADNY